MGKLEKVLTVGVVLGDASGRAGRTVGDCGRRRSCGATSGMRRGGGESAVNDDDG